LHANEEFRKCNKCGMIIKGFDSLKKQKIHSIALVKAEVKGAGLQATNMS
jgi:hypothetical protein